MSEVFGVAMLIGVSGIAMGLGWLQARQPRQQNKEAKMATDNRVIGGVALSVISAMSKVAQASEDLMQARQALDEALLEEGLCQAEITRLSLMQFEVVRLRTALANALYHVRMIDWPGMIPEETCGALDEVVGRIERAGADGAAIPKTLVYERGTAVVA